MAEVTGVSEKVGDAGQLARIVQRQRQCRLAQLRLVADARSALEVAGRWEAAPERLIAPAFAELSAAALEAFVEPWVRAPVTRDITVELPALPAPRSVWAWAESRETLAAALRGAAEALRGAGRAVAWSLPLRSIEPAALQRLASAAVIGPHDACVVSTEGLGRAALEALGAVQRAFPDRPCWLVLAPAGADEGAALETLQEALGWEGTDPPARLYWQVASQDPAVELWMRNGAEATRRLLSGAPVARTGGERVLVTGGAGFVGSNLVARLVAEQREVVILDSLRRPGVERNLEWVLDRGRGRVECVLGDIRSPRSIARALDGVGHVFHLAGQVAVTTSLEAPGEDFEINARGTLHVLEAIRRRPQPPSVLFTSTNKVYGNLPDVRLVEEETRYVPQDAGLRAHGIGEDRPLSLHSPYGCSKGAGDQYVLDYALSYDLAAVVFRMSCIYGPRQFGTEDQGWVAHFVRNALEGRPITIYGDGKQVRDILFIDDLVDAFLRAWKNVGDLRGNAFNLGGGPSNTLSLLELLSQLERLEGRATRVELGPWRRGDQRYYVSDTRKFGAATGWRPATAVSEGLQRLHGWLRDAFGTGGAA